MATCPECDADLEIDADDLEEMETGDPWDCEACGSHLRVTSLSPLEFDGDDDDEDDDDEDDDDGDGDDDDLDDEDEDDADDTGDWEE